MRILKFEIVVGDMMTHLPLKASDKIVLIAEQRGKLILWAETDGGSAWNEPETSAMRLDVQGFRHFIVLGTGHIIPTHAHHVGSVVWPGGDFVWHVYEMK